MDKEQSKAPVLTEHEIQDDSFLNEEFTRLTSKTEEASTEEVKTVEEIKEETEATVDQEVVKEEPEHAVHKQKVILEFAFDAANKLISADTITLPSLNDEKLQSVMEKLPNMSLTDNKEGREWASTLQDSLNKSSFDNMFVPTLEREGSEFRQHVAHNNFNLAGGYPKYPEPNGSVMAGEQAVVRLLNHLGLGNLYSAPMWHSGFWVTFKPATETEMVDLNHLIASDKINFGRYTYGLAFSNLTSYTAERLLRFAADHVYETTIRPEDTVNRGILSYLRAQDIPAFLHGFLCSVYPRGFNYRRPCCNNPSTCKHVAENTINLRHLLVVDNLALTPFQKNHMVKRARYSVDAKSIQQYQDEMARLHPRRHVVEQANGGEVTITLKSPSALEYIEAGHRWIESMVDMVESALGRDPANSERNSLLQEHGLASILCQYSHWVEDLSFGQIDVKDTDTVNAALTHMSSDDELRVKILEAIKAYINDSTIAVVGIPTYDCPSCNTPQTKPSEKALYSEIIPLDVIQVFMHLVRQRIARLTSR